MTIRTINEDNVASYEIKDEVLDRSLFVDVLDDGVLLTIQYEGFEVHKGQLLLSFDDLNTLTQLVNELDRWV